jgi:hypothetical protein
MKMTEDMLIHSVKLLKVLKHIELLGGPAESDRIWMIAAVQTQLESGDREESITS